MKVLILGGTGAMGEPLTEILVNNGHEVYVTSRKHHVSSGNLHFIQGNAKDDSFLEEITQTNYDAIVDFMHYRLDEFRMRMDILLTSANHYLFLSSCRTFAPSEEPITEMSPRLLDVATDADFLATDEYALSKARIEDCLKSSNYHNYSIIRPYITYNTERLQLGMYEKETWLYRALKGRKIIFCKELATKRTTLTYGNDVARLIAKIIGDRKACEEVFNIVTDESMTWGEVFEVYSQTLEKCTGTRPEIVLLDDVTDINKIIGNTYKLKYDRMGDRVFNNEKIMRYANDTEFVSMREGLQKSLETFLTEKPRWKYIQWGLEGYFDRLEKVITPLSEIPSFKQRIKYILFRYTPYLKFYLRKKSERWW